MSTKSSPPAELLDSSMTDFPSTKKQRTSSMNSESSRSRRHGAINRFYVLAFSLRSDKPYSYNHPKARFFGMVPTADGFQIEEETPPQSSVDEKKGGLRLSLNCFKPKYGFDRADMYGMSFAFVGYFLYAISGADSISFNKKRPAKLACINTLKPRARWTRMELPFHCFNPIIGVSDALLYIIPSIQDEIRCVDYNTIKKTEVHIFHTDTGDIKTLEFPRTTFRACHALIEGRLLLAMDGEKDKNFAIIHPQNWTWEFCAGWDALPKFGGRTSFTVSGEILYILDNPCDYKSLESDSYPTPDPLELEMSSPILYAYNIKEGTYLWKQDIHEFDYITTFYKWNLIKNVEIVPVSDNTLCFVWSPPGDQEILYREVLILENPKDYGAFVETLKEDVLTLKNPNLTIDHMMGCVVPPNIEIPASLSDSDESVEDAIN